MTDPAVACRGYVASSGWPCSRVATVHAHAGCRHEHVGRRELCDEHLDDTRRGMHLCGDCLEHDGHKCVLRVARVDRIEEAS